MRPPPNGRTIARWARRSLFETFWREEVAASPAVERPARGAALARSEKLKYEKEVLDFYLTSHPLAQYEKELLRHSSHMPTRCRPFSRTPK